jgi:Ca2+-transporting ATPase
MAPGYGLSIDQVRGMTFAALIFGIVALILVDRSRSASILTAITRPNPALAVVLPIVGALLTVTLTWQPARDLFGFAALAPVHLAVPPLAGLAVLVALEVIKPVWRWVVQRKTVATEVLPKGKAALN